MHGHKLNQFYLYQNNDLPVKENVYKIWDVQGTSYTPRLDKMYDQG